MRTILEIFIFIQIKYVIFGIKNIFKYSSIKKKLPNSATMYPWERVFV